MSSINIKLSEAYGITPLGEYGSQILRDGKQVFKSTNKPSLFENWQEALDYARVHLNTLKPARRDENPILISVIDRWGVKVRVNQNALNDPLRLIIPIYNRNGIRIVDSATYKGDRGSAFIHKANIVGTDQNAESELAVKTLLVKEIDPQADPAEFSLVPGEGAPQYTFYAGKDEQLSLF